MFADSQDSWLGQTDGVRMNVQVADDRQNREEVALTSLGVFGAGARETWVPQYSISHNHGDTSGPRSFVAREVLLAWLFQEHRGLLCS